MRCSKCGADNPERAKFCVECASPFARRCPSCDAENPQTAKFCLECAKPLEGAGGKSQRVHDAGSPIQVNTGTADSLEGERKTVTMLFADIKGSMELIEALDPEEARAIVDPALKLMIDAVHHYDGYVAQSTGDGIFALFGAPVAHEDHPQRALLAALRMQADVKGYAEKLRAEKGVNLQVRVGANTGEVVVRQIRTGENHSEYAPIGHSTGVAARLQALAAPGSIAISESMRKLVEGYFALKPLGPARIKGLSELLETYEVTGLGPLRTRLQRAAARGYTRFVGRQREMETMKRAAELAKTGHGQIVAAVAEPGVGKSRLFDEFKATSQSGWLVLEARSLSHGKASAYLPLIDLLHIYLGIMPDDDALTRREKVVSKIAILDRSLEDDTLPYLFGLLGIGDGEDAVAQMDAHIRRRRTQDAVKRVLLRESLDQPLMLVFEDLHWIDEQTQAFLNRFVDGMANAPILLLVNYRPEYSHQWGSKTYYAQLRLDTLGKEGAKEMLSSLLGDGTQLAALKRIIIEKTEGNPLFMEEIYQALLEEGALQRNGSVRLVRPVEQLRLPHTVQGVLAARIDHLRPEEKELLQTLAVIGIEFQLSLIHQVLQLEPERLEGMLSSLQSSEFIYEQPGAGEVKYAFKHALTRQVADESLLSGRRKLLHERTGKAIETLYSGQLEDHYSELSRHYLLGIDAAKALRYTHLAAEQLLDRGAYSEADGLVAAGLLLLGRLPEGEMRLRAELAIRSIETVLAFVLSGAASPKRYRATTRGCEIAEKLGEQGLLLRELVNLSSLHWLRGESTLGLEIIGRCLELRNLAPDPGLVADVHWMAAVLLEQAGKPRDAVAHYDSSWEAGRDAVQAKRPLSHLWGIPHSIMTAGMACGTLQLLGRIGQATETAEDALRQARSSHHPFALSYALVAGLRLSLLRREPEKMLRYAEEVIALSEKNGFAEWPPFGVFFRGCALADLGEFVKGIALMEGTAEDIKRERNVWPVLMAQLAYGYARIGQTDRALRMLEKIFSEVDLLGSVGDKAEGLRIKGEVLLTGSHAAKDEAEHCFRTAIEVARSQGTKWWELRAATSLARLLAKQDRRDEARAMLSEIYNWFTEGFDTADLKDAKALLDELA
jgi:class 3 adenylate cyclase/tetratricopeptide (TPR) repeat protein